jgi:hypothetical protein
MFSKITKVETYWCNIYIGFREGYSDIVHDIRDAEDICSTFCNTRGLCVTVSRLKFIYTANSTTVHGEEEGCVVGFINYPKFPKEKEEILNTAMELSEIFLSEFNQYKISIVTPEETIMIEP